MSTVDLAAVFNDVADSECRGYSPLYERVCRSIASDEDLLAFVQSTPPPAHWPLVILGAVHFLLLGGIDHPLGAVYSGASKADVEPLFRDFVLGHRDELAAVMEVRRTQTNEVGRSCFLVPAFEWVYRAHGLPLAWVDVGASGGLNLQVDRFRVQVGDSAVGPLDGRPAISCRATGDPPVGESVAPIVWRAGLDKAPIDVGDEEEARWLQACIWPDQLERAQRLRDAIVVARAHPPRLVEGDAVDAIGALLEEAPLDAIAVVTTTWVIAYLARERRRAFEEVLASVGRPVVWIIGEADGVADGIEAGEPPVPQPRPSVLGAVTFDSGQATRKFLAWVQPHGEWLDWRA